MCNILGLDYACTKEKLRQKIIRALMDIQLLVLRKDDDDDEAEDKLDEEPQQQRYEKAEQISNAGSWRANDVSSLSSTDSESSDRITLKCRKQKSARGHF